MNVRPYLAVVRDSFHAAMSSRVLWVAIVAIWILLILLLPFGYREDYTTEFRGQDFHNGTRMKGLLARGLAQPDGEASPVKQLANALPDDLQRQLKRVAEGDEVRIRYSVLTDALNKLIEDESWYDAEIWSSSLRFKELRELDEKSADELSESLRKRRARLRIEAALPGVFQARASRSIRLTYAGLDFPSGTTVDKPQFETLVNQWVLPLIINWLLGFVLIFLGILVTSSIIPDMLQPGSLHLLLSKPISRSVLLLAKFFGGCAFVLLCVTQLVIGLYLIAGLRLDIWNARLLYCIPTSVFLFSVFYCVSVLAGLRWRSPILAIGVTVIFGGICLLVGFIGGLSDGLVTRPDQLASVAVAGEDYFATTRGGGLMRFDRTENEWIEIYESGPVNADRVLQPLAVSDSQIVTARVRGGRFNPFGSGASELSVLSRSNDWNPEPSLRLPTATTSLFYVGSDSIVALNTGELLRASTEEVLDAAGEKDDDAENQDESEQQGDSGSKGNAPASWLSKLNNMIGGTTAGFERVLPESVALARPRSVFFDRNDERVLTYSLGRMVIAQRKSKSASGVWEIQADRTFEGENAANATIGLLGDVAVIARKDEPIRLLDGQTLEDLAEFELAPQQRLSQFVAVPSSQWAAKSGADADPANAASFGFLALMGDGTCRVVEINLGDQPSLKLGRVIGPADVQAVHWDRSSGQLVFAHHTDRLTIVDPESLEVIEEIQPKLSGWRSVDYWLVTPLRTVVPQTGELGETIALMISGKSGFEIDSPDEDDELVQYKVMRPVMSCSIFILVMLSGACVYFSTRDF